MPYVPGLVSGPFAELRDRLNDAIYRSLAALTVEAWRTPEPVPFARRTSGKHLRLREGDKWGDLWDCAWFRFSGRVPQAAAGKHVVLLIDVSGEACVVDRAGEPVLGLTTMSSGFDFTLGRPGKRVVAIAKRAKGGERIDVWADAGNNDLFGKFRNNGVLAQAQIAMCDDEIFALYYDWTTCFEAMGQLPEQSARRQQLMSALQRASSRLGVLSTENANFARAELAPELAKRNGNASLTLSAIGHAHIDLAWLWPLRETYRKVERTFATALNMMERYDNYIFAASQPQQYEWIKRRHPGLYRRIKRRIAEGRWDVHGAMWVEADTNLTCGESLVRQILYGKRFFRDEFGIEVDNLWLPDVFGYSAALPQLMVKSRTPYFSTTKISWNEINVFPHDTFRWRGLDGSEVLAHFPPNGTYNSPIIAKALVESEQKFKDKAVCDRALVVYGIGDGGGGPGVDHLEFLDRHRDFAGLPPVVPEKTSAFFKRIDRARDDYQSWSGELYLEKHQGTYTSQARSKRWNRKIELALRECEFHAAVAARLGLAKYPHQELEEIWKEVLLYQFHDILPGSSIGRVYDESLARYAELAEAIEKIGERARNAIAKNIAGEARRAQVILNATSWERREWMKAEESWQRADVPPMGWTVVESAEAGAEFAITAELNRLENELIRATFAKDGTLSSFHDKRLGREMLTGSGNVLSVWDDSDGNAWDFNFHYRDRASARFELVSSKARTDGPRAILTQRYRFGTSTLTQEIVLTDGSPRLDFVTTVDWREDGKMLRASFPTSVASESVACEIQFGHIHRPTHTNTSWDLAKFEICAHRWIDLAQGDCGLALLNDCKYGHHVRGQLMDINLLRSTSSPDPKADRAEHQFTYALYPHRGGVAEGGVVRAGAELNMPLRTIPLPARRRGSMPTSGSFLSVDADNVVIEAVKIAEDSDALIVRLYEAHGSGCEAELTCSLPIGSAALVDLLEERPQRLALKDGRIRVSFRPFEVHTLRLD